MRRGLTTDVIDRRGEDPGPAGAGATRTVEPSRRRGGPLRSRAGLAAALAVLALVVSSCGWFRYGYDGTNNRTTPFETHISPANADTLVEKWRIDGIKGVTSTPAIFNGRAYFGAWDGTARAVDLATGAPVWSTLLTAGIPATGSMVDDSPLLHDSKVYIGDGAGRIYALDVNTGQILWRTTLDTHPNARTFSSPVLAGDKVVVGVGSYELAFEKADYTFRGSIVALDPTTGLIEWRTYTSNDDATSGAGASVWSTAAVDDARGLLYIGVGQAYEAPAGPYTDALLALDIDTGAIAWSRQFTPDDVYRIFKSPPNGPDADVGAAPNLFTIGGRDVVGVGDKAGVYSVLDRTTGETVWADQLTAGSHLGGVMLTSAVSNGVIYVSSNIMNGSLIDFANPGNTSITFALDATDGSVIWQTALPRASFGALTLANGVLYQPTIPGSYYLLSAATGQILDTLTPSAGAQLGGGASVFDGTVLAPFGMWFFTEATGQQGGLVAYGLPST